LLCIFFYLGTIYLVNYIVTIFLQNLINIEIDQLPINYALLQLVGASIPNIENIPKSMIKNMSSDERLLYNKSKKCVEHLALYLKSFATGIFFFFNLIHYIL